MKKSLIFSLLSTPVLVASLVPSLTSCSCNNQFNNTITLATTQKEWTDPGDSISIEFNLSKELGTDEELVGPILPSGMQSKNADFDGDATWNVTNKKAAATLKFVHSGIAYISASKLNFSIINKTTKEVISTATITDFKVSWTEQSMTRNDWIKELNNKFITDTWYPTNAKQYSKDKITLKIDNVVKEISEVKYEIGSTNYRDAYVKTDTSTQIYMFTPNFIQWTNYLKPETTIGVNYSNKNGIYKYTNSKAITGELKELTVDKNGYLLCSDVVGQPRVEFTYSGEPEQLSIITQSYWKTACMAAIKLNSYSSNPIVQYTKDQVTLTAGGSLVNFDSMEYIIDSTQSNTRKCTLSWVQGRFPIQLHILSTSWEETLPTVSETTEGVTYSIDDTNGFVFTNTSAQGAEFCKLSFNKYGYYTGETVAEHIDTPTIVQYTNIPSKGYTITYDTDSYKIDINPSILEENENIIFNVTLDDTHAVNKFYIVEKDGTEAIPVSSVICPEGWSFDSSTNVFTTDTAVSTGTLQFKVSIPKVYQSLDIKLVNE